MATELEKSSSIRIAWLAFVKVMTELLKPTKNNRPNDQFLELRDKILEVLQSEKFLMELESIWLSTGANKTENPNREEILALLLVEIRSFSRAVEIAMVSKKSERPKRWRDGLLSKAGVVTGSVEDILPELPWYAKSSLTVFKEVCNLFKRGS